MLGRSMDFYSVFEGDGGGGLALKVEMLLRANFDLAFERVGRPVERRDITACIGQGRLDMSVGGQCFVD